MTIFARIEELKATAIGDNVAKIKAALTLEDYSAKDITAALKEAGISSKRKTFATDFYDWLAAEPRKQIDAEMYITGEGEYGETSANVMKHASHYMNIWALAQRVWEAK